MPKVSECMHAVSVKLVIEYEVKSLTMDFDRISRKQIARLKKAK